MPVPPLTAALLPLAKPWLPPLTAENMAVAKLNAPALTAEESHEAPIPDLRAEKTVNER